MHKEDNPRRPVSSVKCHTTKFSENNDFNLQPHVPDLMLYVKDSTDFIRKINCVENMSFS